LRYSASGLRYSVAEYPSDSTSYAVLALFAHFPSQDPIR
jgi:hypothetical protein